MRASRVKDLSQIKHRHLTLRRQWTIEEDRLMVRQSQGEFSMLWLEKELRSSRDSIVLRMRDLGIQPVIQKRRGWKGPKVKLVPPQPVPTYYMPPIDPDAEI